MSDEINILLPMPRQDKGYPIEDLRLAVLDPRKNYVLLIKIPEDTPADFRSYLEEIQAQMAIAGVKAILTLPKSWEVEFLESTETPDDPQSNPG